MTTGLIKSINGDSFKFDKNSTIKELKEAYVINKGGGTRRQ
jgi:hypothetical protein